MGRWRRRTGGGRTSTDRDDVHFGIVVRTGAVNAVRHVRRRWREVGWPRQVEQDCRRPRVRARSRARGAHPMPAPPVHRPPASGLSPGVRPMGRICIRRPMTARRLRRPARLVPTLTLRSWFRSRAIARAMSSRVQAKRRGDGHATRCGDFGPRHGQPSPLLRERAPGPFPGRPGMLRWPKARPEADGCSMLRCRRRCRGRAGVRALAARCHAAVCGLRATSCSWRVHAARAAPTPLCESVSQSPKSHADTALRAARPLRLPPVPHLSMPLDSYSSSSSSSS